MHFRIVRLLKKNLTQPDLLIEEGNTNYGLIYRTILWPIKTGYSADKGQFSQKLIYTKHWPEAYYEVNNSVDSGGGHNKDCKYPELYWELSRCDLVIFTGDLTTPSISNGELTEAVFHQYTHTEIF